MTKQKIVVSGATGFLGSYIIRQLIRKDKYEILGLHRPSSDLFLVRDIYNEISWKQGDIRDIDFLDDVCADEDYFIHTAGLISMDEKDKILMNEINVKGTANVVNACLKNEIKKLIHISSVAALGRPENASHISESTKWQASKNNTQYAISKYEADIEIFRGNAEGLNTFIIYPSTILGSGDWQKGSTSLFRRVHDGLKYYTKGINGFVDVRDVALIIEKMINKKTHLKGIIASSENLSYQYVFNEMAKQFKVKKPSQLLTKNRARIALFLAGLISRITNRKSIISKDSIVVALSAYFYNNERSKELLGIDYIPIDQSIKETCRALNVKYKT